MESIIEKTDINVQLSVTEVLTAIEGIILFINARNNNKTWCHMQKKVEKIEGFKNRDD